MAAPHAHRTRSALWRRIVATATATAGAAAVLVAAAPTAGAADPDSGSFYYFEGASPPYPDGTVVVSDFTATDAGERALPGATLGEFSADGQRVTFAKEAQQAGRTYTRINTSAPDGSAGAVVSTPDPATQSDTGPHWGPDGTLLFTRTTTTPTGTRQDVWSVKADGTAAHAVVPDTAVLAVNPKTGDAITGATTATDLRTRNQSGGYDAPKALPEPMRGATDPAFSPDGGKVAFSRQGRLYLGAADTTMLREVTAGLCADVRNFAWGPHGDRLALTTGVDGAAIIGLRGESLRTHTVWSVPTGGRFMWQPDGQPGPATPPPPVTATPAPARFAAETPGTAVYGEYYGDKCRAVIARSADDGSLWMHMYRAYENAWSPWQRIGGPTADVVVYPFGDVPMLVARNPVDHSVYATRQSTLPGQWRPWQRIGGPAADLHVVMGPRPVKSQPSAVVLARSPSTSEIYALQLLPSWPIDPTPAWTRFGGPAADVAVAVNPAGTGRLVVARSPADGSVYAKELPEYLPGGPYPIPPAGDWYKLGGPARAVSVTAGGTVITAQNPVDGSLWTRVSAAPDAPWHKAGPPAAGFTSALGANGTFTLFAQNPQTRALSVSAGNTSTNGQWTPQPWRPVGIPTTPVLPAVDGTRLTTVTTEGAILTVTCDQQWQCT